MSLIRPFVCLRRDCGSRGPGTSLIEAMYGIITP